MQRADQGLFRASLDVEQVQRTLPYGRRGRPSKDQPVRKVREFVITAKIDDPDPERLEREEQLRSLLVLITNLDHRAFSAKSREASIVKACTIGRRALLCAAAVAVGSALSGCLSTRQSLTVAAGILRRKLVLPSAPLFNWENTIQAALAREPQSFQIEFQQAAGHSAPQWVDIRDAWKGGDVTPVLKSLNMPTTVLSDYVIQPFLNGSGALSAFPISLGQLQFYVNSNLLNKLGLTPPPTWTWADLTVAVNVALQQDINAAQVIGWGWGELNTWACLVHGLGATVVSPTGSFDWTGVAEATTKLVQFARLSNWRPMEAIAPLDAPQDTAVAWDFFVNGFSKAFSRTLFGVMPPWTGRYADNPFNGMYALPDTCSQGGLCSLRPTEFPVLPNSNGVPIFGWGLRPTGRGFETALFGEFVQWLYQPAQQKALAVAGFMPLLSDKPIQHFWSGIRSENDPLFDPSRVFNAAKEVAGLNPGQMFLGFSQLYNGAKVDAEIEGMRAGTLLPPK